MERNIYLSTITPEEAVARAKAALNRETLVGAETVPAHESAGRVTAAPVYARYSSPTFHSAAMDGIAVKAEATFAAGEGRPVRLSRGSGYEMVNTGQVLPPWADAVIMIEDVVQEDEHTVSIEAPAFPWRHVRRIGEDIVATELLLPQNHLITPYDVGALLSAGIFELSVRERVKAVFIPTGDEVLDFTTRPAPAPGQVVESNSQIFCAWARLQGAEPRRVAPVPDDPDALKDAVKAALGSDAQVVVLGAGSSAGSKDYTRAVFESVGRVLSHGLSVMPGKPTVVGEARGKLLVGAPGYPVSSVVCFERVLGPVLAWLSRREEPARPEIRVALTRKTPSRLGMEEVVRLAVGRVGERYVATPLNKGAGMLTTLTKAQALTRIPAGSEGLEAGAEVAAELLVPESSLQKVLVHVGSHDNTLDLIANELMGAADPIQLVSANAGSMGGLSALAAGSCLFAGCHLFDPESGDFNFPFLAKHLPDLPVAVVNLAVRHQGLIVAPGNPKNIRAAADLARPEVLFINRQKGAGTRILLDHALSVAGIEPGQVRGYQREEYTHMAVAVNVLTGAADCGLGIRSAAKALSLDFAPLALERYDLIIPTAFLEDPKIKALLALVRDPAFQAKIRALGGYETDLSGQVMTPGLGLSGMQGR
jgi:putative molybdopterin biosynthesis protein